MSSDGEEIFEELEQEFSMYRSGEVDPDYSPFVTGITLSVGTVYTSEQYCDKHQEMHPAQEENVIVIGLFFHGSEEDQEQPDKELMIAAEGGIGQMILTGKMGKILKKRLKTLE